MNNDRILHPPEARYGFYGACSHGMLGGQKTFSLRIFEIEPRSGPHPWKCGKTVCRVKSHVGKLGVSLAKETAELICQCLEAGIVLTQKSYTAGYESNAKFRRLLERP